MIGFEIVVNGRHLFTAAVGDAGVLSAFVTWVGGKSRSPDRREMTRAGVTDLHVGGVSILANERLQWPSRVLRAGDEVTVRVLKAAVPDSPSGRTIINERTERQTRREHYRIVKKKYLELRAEFEPEAKPKVPASRKPGPAPRKRSTRGKTRAT